MKPTLRPLPLLSFITASLGETPTTNDVAVSAPPHAPAVLPGQGLAQRDFFRAGEAKEERTFIVRDIVLSKVIPSTPNPGN